MPILGDSVAIDTFGAPGGSFQFSGARIQDLGATEYTLVTLIVDVTGSVSAYESELRQALKIAVKACSKSPRADNLLVRLVTFNNNMTEVFGFKPLTSIDADNDFNTPFRCNGMTALYDATHNVVAATSIYGKQLTDSDFTVNGIAFVITDGEDNASVMTPRSIRDSIDAVVRDEIMESLMVILVGINDSRCAQYLNKFQQEAGLTQYVSAGSFDVSSAAKLAEFVSRSITSQSQALGTGGPSQSLNF